MVSGIFMTKEKKKVEKRIIFIISLRTQLVVKIYMIN